VLLNRYALSFTIFCPNKLSEKALKIMKMTEKCQNSVEKMNILFDYSEN